MPRHTGPHGKQPNQEAEGVRGSAGKSLHWASVGMDEAWVAGFARLAGMNSGGPGTRGCPGCSVAGLGWPGQVAQPSKGG